MTTCPNCRKTHNVSGLTGFHCSCGYYMVVGHNKWFPSHRLAVEALGCKHPGPSYFPTGKLNSQSVMVPGCPFFAAPGSKMCKGHQLEGSELPDFYVLELQDFYLSLGEVRDIVSRLIGQHGESSMLFPDAGANNVSFYLKVKR